MKISLRPAAVPEVQHSKLPRGFSSKGCGIAGTQERSKINYQPVTHFCEASPAPPGASMQTWGSSAETGCSKAAIPPGTRAGEHCLSGGISPSRQSPLEIRGGLAAVLHRGKSIRWWEMEKTACSAVSSPQSTSCSDLGMQARDGVSG